MVTGATGATLDGFTITAGNADVNDVFDPNGNGGGMVNWGSSNPTLTNLTFSGNSTRFYGGGMLNNSSSPTLTNVTFSGNSAIVGGGMYNYTSSNPTLTNVTFTNNSATTLNGGGMYNYSSSSPTLTNVTFSGNTAGEGGGMFNESSSPTLTNVAFSGNTVTEYAGGMENYAGSSPTLTNVTFNGNSATAYGGGMGNNTSNPQIHNTIFWGNTATVAGTQQIYNENSTPGVSFSVVDGGYAGGSNIITTDPKLGALGNYGGFTQTIPLLPGSSATDAGSNATCATTDQRGVTRPQPAGGKCDIGAYEYVDATAPMVTSVTRLNLSPTHLVSVDFTVTFSEAVSGVDTSDFALTASGVSGAAVSGFSGSGSVYTVTVNTGTGVGTIRLDVPTSATVTDLAGNPLAGLPYTSGETYTVEEKLTGNWIYLPQIRR